MQEFQQRVVKEKEELDLKMDKLNDFIMSNFFDSLSDEEQTRLALQSIYMGKYSAVLGERIVAF